MDYESVVLGQPETACRLAGDIIGGNYLRPSEASSEQVVARPSVVSAGMHTGVLGSPTPFSAMMYSLAVSGAYLSLSNSSISMTNAHDPVLVQVPTATGSTGLHLVGRRQRKQPLAAQPALSLSSVMGQFSGQLKMRYGPLWVNDPILRSAIEVFEGLWPEGPGFLTEQLGRFNAGVVRSMVESSAPSFDAPALWIAHEEFIASFVLGQDQYIGTEVYRMLFDGDGLAVLARLFEGLPGFSNSPHSSRTSFFWKMDTRGAHRRVATRIEGRDIVADSGERYPLEVGVLGDLLHRRVLIPNGLYKYLLLYFGMAVPMAGGHNQVQALETISAILRAAGVQCAGPPNVFRPTRMWSGGPERDAPSPFAVLVRGAAGLELLRWKSMVAGTTIADVISMGGSEMLRAIRGSAP